MEIFHDSNGVKYNGDGISLNLDPKIAHDGINFTSHAHMDHLPSARSTGTVLCTHETVEKITENITALSNVKSGDQMRIYFKGL